MSLADQNHGSGKNPSRAAAASIYPNEIRPADSNVPSSIFSAVDGGVNSSINTADDAQKNPMNPWSTEIIPSIERWPALFYG
ncbi:hypothetical protein ACLOJK_003860 [Asimina triloba]